MSVVLKDVVVLVVAALAADETGVAVGAGVGVGTPPVVLPREPPLPLRKLGSV